MYESVALREKKSVALQTELSSFLVEITALIFKKKDEDGKSYILDSIQDKTGMKGTGMHFASSLLQREYYSLSIHP